MAVLAMVVAGAPTAATCGCSRRNPRRADRFHLERPQRAGQVLEVRPGGRRAHHDRQVSLDRRDVDSATRVPDEAQRLDETRSLHFNAGAALRFALGQAVDVSSSVTARRDRHTRVEAVSMMAVSTRSSSRRVSVWTGTA